MHLKCAISHKGRVAVAVASCPPMTSFNGLERTKTFGMGVDIEKCWRGDFADAGTKQRRLERLRERILCDEVEKIDDRKLTTYTLLSSASSFKLIH